MEYISKEDFEKQYKKLIKEKNSTNDVDKISDIDLKMKNLKKLRFESAVKDEFEKMKNRSK